MSAHEAASPAALPGDVPSALAKILEVLDLAKDAENIEVGGKEATGTDLRQYSILEVVNPEAKLQLVLSAAEDPVLNKVMGSMCGMAVGDALGHPYEFEPVQDVAPDHKKFDLNTFKFHGESNVFRLDRGQWTDDASMGLCMADSLIVRRQFDGSDMRTRFWCWWNRGYCNAFRKEPTDHRVSVGLGGNISKSLAALRPGQKPPPVYQATSEDAGNGSLMRFTPVALFMHSAPLEQVYEVSRASSYTTHPGIIAAEACSLLGHLIVEALRLPQGEPRDVKAFLEKATTDYLDTSGLRGKSGWGYDQMKWLVTSTPVNETERCWNWKAPALDIAGTLRARGSRYNGYPVSAGYFGAYSLDGLAMALWSVYHTTSFDEAVTRSVNLCGDADSHGSITGQLAGAIYGFKAINRQFIEWLAKWDDYDFAVKGLLLHHLGSRSATR